MALVRDLGAQLAGDRRAGNEGARSTTAKYSEGFSDLQKPLVIYGR